MIENAIYIGAGLDVRPLKAMFYVSTFVYIDSRPNSANPGCGENQKDDFEFVYEFNLKMMALRWEIQYPVGWKEKETEPFCLKYTKGSRKLYYYFNTAFPQQVSDELRDKIAACSTLIVAGFAPHKSVLEMMSPGNKQFIGWEGTWYGKIDDPDDSEYNNVVQYVQSTQPVDVEFVYYYKKYISKQCRSLSHMHHQGHDF